MVSVFMSNINKPNFIIIGSMKSGTTSLYDDLAKSNALFLPTEKEPAILSKYTQLDQIQKAYLRHFNNNNGLMCGEASTVYTASETIDDIVARAKALCGNDLRLIMIMRDPIERIYSHLRHDISCGRINIADVENVVLNDEKYTSISDYAIKVKPWIDAFGISNILCISFADYCTNRKEAIKQVADFLEIDFNVDIIDVTSVSNKSSELRRTNKYIMHLIRSKIYRHYVRPVLSTNVIKKLRIILLPRKVAPKFKLSEKTEKQLKLKLINVENDLEILLGKKLNIFTHEYQ